MLNNRARERIATQKAYQQVPEIDKAAKIQETYRKLKVLSEILTQIQINK